MHFMEDILKESVSLKDAWAPSSFVTAGFCEVLQRDSLESKTETFIGFHWKYVQYIFSGFMGVPLSTVIPL